jgi:hypothetical protein
MAQLVRHHRALDATIAPMRCLKAWFAIACIIAFDLPERSAQGMRQTASRGENERFTGSDFLHLPLARDHERWQ